MKDIDRTNLYNKVIDYLEDKYYFLNDKERRIFIVAYLSALRDNEEIDNKDYLQILEDILMNI